MHRSNPRHVSFLVLILSCLLQLDPLQAQSLRQPERDLQRGRGRGRGRGGGRGFMWTVHNLFDHRNEIVRTVNKDSDGTITATTTSNNDQVASWLQEHVRLMSELVENQDMVRGWDPLFYELFERADEIEQSFTYPDNGVHVVMKGLTDCGASLAEAHAQAVSWFRERGRSELHESHSIPDEC